ncbi:MAG: O-antigen ligase family protein [Variovorax sp.]
MTSTPTRWVDTARDALLVSGRWFAVLSLFAVSLNKPATNILLALSLVCALLGSQTRERWIASARHPVVIGALVWWGVMVLSGVHAWAAGHASLLTGTPVWALWYPLVLGTLLTDTAWRRRGLIAFAAAVALVLLISCGQFLGIFPQREVALALPAMRNTVFKEYTQQGLSFLMLASMAVAVALVAQRPKQRMLACALALLTLVNVVFILKSRTTYITLVPLIVYWAWRLFGRRGAGWRAIAATGALLLAIAALSWAVQPVRERLLQSVTQEVTRYATQREPTSMGIRLELWRRTLPLIQDAPVFGHGLGQWQPLYRKAIENLPQFDAFLMGHPHQEMLLIWTEQGTVGLLVYLALLVALARYIRRLDAPYRDIYAGILLIYVTAGLANGLWADFTHRHVFILLLACIPLAPTMKQPARTARIEP